MTIKNSIWSLCSFYNDKQKQGNGALFDMKYVDLLLKGILGYDVMANMDLEPDFDDPKLKLAKGKSWRVHFFS